jgi:serine O-acetyltransferase
MMSCFAGLASEIEADFEHACAAWDAPRPKLWSVGLAKCVIAPRVRAVLYYRIAHRLWCVRALRPFALLLQARAIGFSGAEIHPAAVIGPGLLLVHSQGVVIGHAAVLGREVALYQGVTVGHGGSLGGQPVVGDRVRVFAGAKVLGAVQVGDEAWIAANAVVVKDVSRGGRVGGVPARNLGTDGGEDLL